MSGTGNVAYETSKTALLGLARSIAVEYGLRGIRANALCPGWVQTPSGDRSMEELMAERGISLGDAYRLVTQDIPLRRPATAGEIAACCLFLASDESSIVTGTTLVADGGGLAVDLTEIWWQEHRCAFREGGRSGRGGSLSSPSRSRARDRLGAGVTRPLSIRRQRS